MLISNGPKDVLIQELKRGDRQQLVWSMPRYDEQTEVHDLMHFSSSAYARAGLQRAAAQARTDLRDAARAATEAAARARAVALALDEALAFLEQTPAAEAAVRLGGDSIDVTELSPREREVLALVAEGRSNKAIAEALFVSPNTIKTHVASILHKMRADSRVQLAAMAARNEGAANVRGFRSAAAQ